MENKLSGLSDRWSNVCKFVGNRWFTVQDLIIKLQSIESDFNDLNTWISNKSIQLNYLIKKTKPMLVKNKLNVSEKFSKESLDQKDGNTIFEEYDSIEFNSSLQMIKILKEIEYEMQAMHAKLNDMNDIGEQIGTQLNNSPQLSNSINNKMDTLESKWNSLLEQMEYLSKVCTEQQQFEIRQQEEQTLHSTLSSKLDEDPDVSLAENSAAFVKKRRMEIDEIKQFKSVDMFVNQLNLVFERVANLLNFGETSAEEQHESAKVS